MLLMKLSQKSNFPFLFHADVRYLGHNLCFNRDNQTEEVAQ